jgi:hypothetical protein
METVTLCHGPSGPYDFDDHCTACGIMEIAKEIGESTEMVRRRMKVRILVGQIL